jgi:DNA-binding protein YbaB
MTPGPRFEELAAKARRVHDAVTLVRGHARSAAGHVAVEADAAGSMVSLVIDDGGLALGATALAAAIADTHRAACADAARQAQALRDELVADPLVARVVAGVGSALSAAPRSPLEPADEDEDGAHYRSGVLRPAWND